MRRVCICAILLALQIVSGGCEVLQRWTRCPPLPTLLDLKQSKSDIYAAAELDRDLDDLDLDGETTSFRFVNASIVEVVFDINVKFPEYVVYWIPSQKGQVSAYDVIDGTVSGAVGPVVTGYFEGSIYEILRDICVCNGLYLEKVDNKYYLFENRADTAIIFTTATLETNLEREELDALLNVRGERLRYFVVGSKVALCGSIDEVKVARDMIAALSDKKTSYVANVVLVRMKVEDLVRLQTELKSANVDLISQGYDLYDLFDAKLDMKFTYDKSYTYSEQILYCTDGQKSNLKIGTEIQREERTISDMGTSSIRGYKNFNDGIELEITPKRTVANNVSLALKFSSSKFQSVDQLTKEQVDLNYDQITIEANKVYYVASFNDMSRERSGVFVGLGHKNSDTVLTCWLVLSPVVSNRSSQCLTKD